MRITTTFAGGIIAATILGALAGTIVTARADVALQREPPDGGLRLGQRVRVDDGTCPAGQVKLVTAGQLTSQGIVTRTRSCVKR